jgi:hypothetical protein
MADQATARDAEKSQTAQKAARVARAAVVAEQRFSSSVAVAA